ncbi:ACP S-malonyltransferase [Roseococcus pinisoli]|uniref:Malonyl CoA-acyl carrier protein transacylase n=1 Tax=Roseococcus pinisoli TaxID=2835040 RepID=A0ABS5QA63_9PROT|nr:ACP S-malonyltransferase [Roseococcus pinisoli]MBS7810599.1 ACP S-malonyltransferase [Roseococcus pinisoli]
MSLAFVFPGQGSQAPGMGRDLADAFPIVRETFQEVDDALSQKLSKLMFEGPAEELTLTANAQPALMAVSVAVCRALAKEGNFDLSRQVSLVAGHSLGEYSALTAAGTFDLPTAARLLRLRGESMQKAVPPGQGAMAALLGAEADLAAAICAEAEAGDAGKDVIQVANDNGGGQVVISGAKAAVERAVELAKAKGVKRAMLLPVSAPFHCAMMAPAADVMAEALEKAAMAHPAVPVVANVTAAPVSDPAQIRQLLVQQVTGTVRWRECIAAMVAAGSTRFVEVGSGKVLTGLMKRNAPEATALALNTPADVEAFLKSL